MGKLAERMEELQGKPHGYSAEELAWILSPDPEAVYNARFLERLVRVALRAIMADKELMEEITKEREFAYHTCDLGGRLRRNSNTFTKKMEE